MVLVDVGQKRRSGRWSIGLSSELVDFYVRIEFEAEGYIPVMSGNSLMHPSNVDISRSIVRGSSVLGLSV